MSILAIDPGPNQSAVLIYDPNADSPIVAHGILDNDEVIREMGSPWMAAKEMAVEMVASYGMAVGRDVFETVYWIGRFCQRWESFTAGVSNRVYRKDIKLFLCNSPRAKDANVRQAIIDRFPATGGGRVPQIGTKNQPGPLYGVKSHVWSALAVALYFAEARQPVKEAK